MRVLVVEDDEQVSEMISECLQIQGYSVDVSRHGIDALTLATISNYDIILLDIMMPGMDGWEIIKKLRDSGNKTPIICMTAVNTLEGRIKGLRLGADDYITKPFTFTDLLKRIQTVFRRSRHISSELHYSIADLELDLVEHTVMRQGSRIDLNPEEFELLHLLMKRMGEVLSIERIAETIWNLNELQETQVVDLNMARLRAKIDGPFERKVIQSIEGGGYVIEDRG